MRSLYTKHSDSSRLAGAIALHNTLERSRNPTQSARLGVVKFWSGFLGSHNLLLVLILSPQILKSRVISATQKQGFTHLINLVYNSSNNA
ncbi:hypothetical protein [Limnospira maxima]|uniref:hypothetical protein n=1 Tax=Limnospira maxima TaxID=129910 RepID=UPI0002E17DAC|nr:hypothetical protein [Limnospira maxima]